MTQALWQGNWISRTRIITGLVLFTYALFHFLNIGLGLLSPQWMDSFQDIRKLISRHPLGSAVLYLSLILHAGLALWSLARRRSFKMRLSEAVQLVFGFLIPLQLLSHLVYTRYGHEIHGVHDEMPYILLLMWNSPEVWQQSALLLVVWIHGCIGLHYWLRLTRWWGRLTPWLVGLAVFIPGFALAGLLTEGRRVYAQFLDDNQRAALLTRFNWPNNEAFADMFSAETLWTTLFLALLGLALAAHFTRRLLRRRQAVMIRYADGPQIRAERGMTLLEMSRAHGVQHTALCGGKGRCTTCRVVVDQGGEHLPPPAPPEARSLARVNAPDGMRLACQIRPQAPLSVTRMFRPDGRLGRAHASQGSEQQLAVLFLDMRGFTARTAGQLPYDVVFLLNRFFDAIVPAITDADGSVDKYLGDGLLALFDAPSPQISARNALTAAAAIGSALQDFNARMQADGEPEVRIGIGLHLGDLVLGEIGSAAHAPRTIIGDCVNTASRLEAQTKPLGVELLVSARVLAVAGYDPARLEMQPFTLRGVRESLLALPVEQAAALPRILSTAR